MRAACEKIAEIVVPPVLQDPAFRFILVRPRGKEPVERGWAADKNYAFHDSRLLAHIASGGNYGVLGGCGGLCILDFDRPEVAERLFKIEELAEHTLVVRTGSGGFHVYLRTQKPQRSFNIPPLKVEIRGVGRFVVGPNCVHPSGRRYEIIGEPDGILTVGEDFEKLLREAIERKFGLRVQRLSMAEGGGEPPAFGGKFCSLPCVRTLFKIRLPEGFRRKGARFLALAWLLDHTHGDCDRASFLCFLKSYADLQNRAGHPHRLNEYDWLSTVQRRGARWSCTSVVWFFRRAGIYPPCSQECPLSRGDKLG